MSSQVSDPLVFRVVKPSVTGRLRWVNLSETPSGPSNRGSGGGSPWFTSCFAHRDASWARGACGHLCVKEDDPRESGRPRASRAPGEVSGTLRGPPSGSQIGVTCVRRGLRRTVPTLLVLQLSARRSQAVTWSIQVSTALSSYPFRCEANWAATTWSALKPPRPEASVETVLST